MIFLKITRWVKPNLFLIIMQFNYYMMDLYKGYIVIDMIHY